MKSFVLAASLAVAPAFVSALWPIPRTLLVGSTPLRLANSFSINASFDNAPSDLEDAIARAVGFLKSDALAPLVPDRGASLAANVSGASELGSLLLSLGEGVNTTSIAEEAIKAVGERDEAYVLNVPADGSAATLEANSTLGLFRGLMTFGQLWYTVGEQTFTTEAPIAIQDTPAFPFRGFMLDTARNYFPVSDIKRTIDAMSWVKLNQFHWHVVDATSFPLVIPGFEELSAAAAYDNSSIYTPSDVSDIVSYAAARGIDVLIEVDTPGHTSAISKSHPEHMACAEATPWATFSGEPPAGQLRLTSNETANFTAGMLSAVAQMFPGKLFSTGGDEINAPCYDFDAETQAVLNATGMTIDQALSSFTAETHAALRSLGKTPIIWEEMVLDHNVTTLGNDTITMVWISSTNVAAVAERGFRVVHAASDYFYLDCGHGGWVGNAPTLNSWCDPFKTWQLSYTFDPYSNLTAAQEPLILGGEHLIWTEQSGPENLDSSVWPRAATSAEVFWTGAVLPDGSARNNSVDAALPRLHDLSFRLRARGVQSIALQPLYCALRPGVCDLTA